MGYQLDRSDPVPDFVCSGLRGQFAAEAVTVGPTKEGGAVVPPPPLGTSEAEWSYLREYMPIKFGSALFSKLHRAYWERPNVAGKPLVFAVEDFSSPASMTHTRPALNIYLYGYEHDWERDADGKLAIIPGKIETHQWGEKEI